MSENLFYPQGLKVVASVKITTGGSYTVPQNSYFIGNYSHSLGSSNGNSSQTTVDGVNIAQSYRSTSSFFWASGGFTNESSGSSVGHTGQFIAGPGQVISTSAAGNASSSVVGVVLANN